MSQAPFLLQREDSRLLTLDNLLLGGVAVLLSALDLIFGLPETDGEAPWSLFLLIMISFPHFALTYFRFYGLFREQLFKRFEFFLHGFIVPLILGALGFACIWHAPLRGPYVMIMLLTVGWHYSRQTYGYIMLLLRERGVKDSARLAPLLNFQCAAVWVLSLALSRAPWQGPRTPYGFTVPLGNISWFVLAPILIAAFVSTLLTIYHFVKVYDETGFDSALTKILLVFFANFILQIYSTLRPEFWGYVPLLHSLQYLPIYSRTEARGLKWGKYLLAAILGALFLREIPMYLDQPAQAKVWLMVAATFINVHHFSMESVIWKSSNIKLRGLAGI